MTEPSAAELLLDCLRCLPAAAAPNGTRACSAASWEAVAREAARHDVAPLLYRRAREGMTPPPPSDLLGGLREAYLDSAARGVAARRQLARLLAALAEAGVPVIVLKGAYLGEALYGDAALRPMGDIDLLVRPADLSAAGRALRALGYAEGEPRAGDPDYSIHHHARPFRRPGAFAVELHRNLVDDSGPVRIDADRLWTRAIATRLAGVPALALSHEDLVVHLCVHAACNHRFAVPLRAVYDVALCVERLGGRLDWRRLVAVANDAGAGPFVSGMLRVAADMLGAEPPRDALERLAGDGTAGEIVGVVRAQLLSAARALPDGMQRLHDAAGVAERVRVAARLLFPPGAELRRIYRLPAGSAAVPLCRVLRPLGIVARCARSALAAVARPADARRGWEQEERRARIERWLSARGAPLPQPYAPCRDRPPATA